MSWVEATRVTMIAAALVIPPVVARMLTHTFGRMLAISTVLGAVAGFVGMNLSYHLDVASGPTIVMGGLVPAAPGRWLASLPSSAL